MWFRGTDFWILLVAALCMVVCFWFAAKEEDRKRRNMKRRDARRVYHEERDALGYIYHTFRSEGLWRKL